MYTGTNTTPSPPPVSTPLKKITKNHRKLSLWRHFCFALSILPHPDTNIGIPFACFRQGTLGLSRLIGKIEFISMLGIYLHVVLASPLCCNLCMHRVCQPRDNPVGSSQFYLRRFSESVHSVRLFVRPSVRSQHFLGA